MDLLCLQSAQMEFFFTYAVKELQLQLFSDPFAPARPQRFSSTLEGEASILHDEKHRNGERQVRIHPCGRRI